ncbi:ESCRT-II complex subunit [Diaporthe sp. PMI_573]|nr:ESCRT-II complex subunit [Diaporthaceae sp. PMI_573]
MAASTSTAAAAAAFDFPREYYFPPFFTRQTNLNTHHAQLVKWSALVLSYCQHHRIFKLPLSPTTTSTATAEDIFFNRRLNRRLALADVREVIDFMKKDGRAEYVGESEGAGAGGDVVWVYWRTPEEWAALVEAWVDETAQKGTVLTLYELTEGEGTRGSEFHGLDQDLLQKALNVLVKRGKAQIFGQEDSQGVKFF